MCWKWPCDPIEIFSCCYLLLHGKWQYYRDLRDLPPEWIAKIEKFHEKLDDITLGYVVIFNDDDTICSIIAIMLYKKEDRLIVDFIDVDEFLRLVDTPP